MISCSKSAQSIDAIGLNIGHVDGLSFSFISVFVILSTFSLSQCFSEQREQ